MKNFSSLNRFLGFCCLLFWLVNTASADNQVLDMKLALDLTHTSEGRTRHIETSPHLKVRAGEEAEVEVSSTQGEDVAVKVVPTLREDGSVDLKLKIRALFGSTVIERKMRLIVAKSKPAEMEVADENTTLQIKVFVSEVE